MNFDHTSMLVWMTQRAPLSTVVQFARSSVSQTRRGCMWHVHGASVYMEKRDSMLNNNWWYDITSIKLGLPSRELESLIRGITNLRLAKKIGFSLCSRRLIRWNQEEPFTIFYCCSVLWSCLWSCLWGWSNNLTKWAWLNARACFVDLFGVTKCISTTGRQPLPIIAAVLTFFAQVNLAKLEIEEVAREVYWYKQASIQASLLRTLFGMHHPSFVL